LLVRRRATGYILLEALMSMALLSVGLIVVNGVMRDTFLTRGLARDYTQARFLLEETVANLELQPLLLEDSASGRFEGEFSRFGWKWKVTKVEVPPPPIPPDLPPEEAAKFKLSVGYLAKIEATVSWTRRGRTFEKTVETLWGPEKLFIPKDETMP
jgi:hypothetical protein